MKFTSSKEAQRGVGLIEVLVALTVLSVGFLAAATMQVQGMRTNQSANERAQALVLLGDMMDRMRSNPEAVADGLYDEQSTGSKTEPACISSSCTAAQIADVDLYEWSANFQSLRGESKFTPALPYNADGTPATGSVSLPTDDLYTLTITWQSHKGLNTIDETVSLSFIP